MADAGLKKSCFLFSLPSPIIIPYQKTKLHHIPHTSNVYNYLSPSIPLGSCMQCIKNGIFAEKYTYKTFDFAVKLPNKNSHFADNLKNQTFAVKLYCKKLTFAVTLIHKNCLFVHLSPAVACHRIHRNGIEQTCLKEKPRHS